MTNTDKENYTLISIPATLTKAYEGLIYNQMYPYFDKRFEKFQFCLRKVFNAPYFLITMLGKWWRSVDGGSQAGVVLTDILKAFVCIDNELLITKLHAFTGDGFCKNSLYFIH